MYYGMSVSIAISFIRFYRAMSPINGCPKKFRESLTTLTATFTEIFNGLFFRLSLEICVQNMKFVALPVPEIIGGTQKNLGSPCIRPRSLSSKMFNGLLFGWSLLLFWLNMKFVALPVPEIIAIRVLVGVGTPILGKGRPYGVGDSTVRKSDGEFL